MVMKQSTEENIPSGRPPASRSRLPFRPAVGRWLYMVTASFLALQVSFIGVAEMRCHKEETPPDTVAYALAGTCPFGSYQTVAFDTARKIAFCGSGASVHALDITDPANPTLLSDQIRTVGGVVQSVAYDYSANRLVACTRESTCQLELWDVSSPTSPVFRGSCGLGDDAGPLAIVAGYAVVGGDRLRVYDVSSSATPQLVATEDSIFARAVVGLGHYVLTNGSGLTIVSLADPAHPVVTGRFETPDVAYDIAVLGQYAFLVCYDSGLVAIDVSDSSSPRKVGQCGYGYMYDRRVVTSGSFAYVFDSGRGDVVDVSNPSKPRIVTQCGGGFSAVAADSLLLFANGSLDVWRTTDGSNPVKVGVLRSPGSPSGVATAASIAYVPTDQAWLSVIDASDLSRPTVLARCDFAEYGWGHIAVSGRWALLGGPYCHGLTVVDIGNPRSPTPAGSWNLVVNDFAAAGDNAYLVGLSMFSVIPCDPSGGQVLGQLDVPDASSVCASGNYAYVTAMTNVNSSALYVISVADPHAPAVVGSCSFSCPGISASAAAADSSCVYLGSYFGHLLCVDVSRPSKPRVVADYTSPDWYEAEVSDIAVAGTHVLVCLPGVVTALDVADPSNPRVVYTSPHLSAAGIGLTSDGVVVAGYAGVVTLRKVD